MALVLKTMYQGYFYLMEDVADPRLESYFMMNSILPVFGILAVWFMFIFKWGPDYMKNRKPFNLKYIMIAYNIAQVIINLSLLYYLLLAINIINWRCSEMDYSHSYWGLKFVSISYMYFVLKLLDLLDTVFFVLRKKNGHINFLHVYHHAGMSCLAWFGAKFLPGGHTYFVGLANCTIHAILYSYYLLTAYDSKYSKLLWLKKFITQAQLGQFVFLTCMFGQLLFISDCKYPKVVTCIFVTQNIFMIILFGDFYIRTYHKESRKTRKALEEKNRKDSEKQEENPSDQEKLLGVVLEKNC